MPSYDFTCFTIYLKFGSSHQHENYIQFYHDKLSSLLFLIFFYFQVITELSNYLIMFDILSREQKETQVAVARSDFFKGTSPLLLYTERYHFYKRPTIKGVRHIVFYDLPTYPHFFPEMCNMMTVSTNSCLVLCLDPGLYIHFIHSASVRRNGDK